MCGWTLGLCDKRYTALDLRNRSNLDLPINRFSAPFADAFDLAIEGDVRGIAVRLNGNFGIGLGRRHRRGAFRRAMMRPCNDCVGRALRDPHCHEKRSHF
jgi:hypothetical protein